MDTHDEAEAGETLAELLVAIVILGIAVVVLITGMVTAIKGSQLHREQTLTDAALRTWGEAIGANITDATYKSCAQPSDYAFITSTAPAATVLPAGATTSAADVLVGSADATTWAHCGDPLPAGGSASDQGVQEITLRAVVPTANKYPGFTQTLNVIVRKPCTTTC